MNKLLSYDFNSCLDVGANIGQFASEILKDRSIRIVSIEPNTNCERFLKKVVNEYFICALGDKEEVLELLVPSDKIRSKASSFFLHSNKTGEDDVIRMQTNVKIGDMMFKDDTFDLIKIDTQGYEYFVISGAKNLIQRSKYVLIEYQTTLTNKGAPNSAEAVTLLESLDFFICDLIAVNDSDHLAKFGSVHLDILFEKRDGHNLDCLGEYKNILLKD